MRITMKQIIDGEQNILTKENCYGFYDWFCKDSSLKRKGEKLLKIAVALSKSPRLYPAATGVFFKNNCPCVGSLYDDLRFVNAYTGDVIFTVIPKSGHQSDKGRAEVWGCENGFKEPLKVGTWREVKNWFLCIKKGEVLNEDRSTRRKIA